MLEFPDHKFLLKAIAPTQLHLLLGVFNLFCKHHIDLRTIVNSCMKLLRNINKLHELFKRKNFVEALGFIQTLKLFENVVKA